VNRTPTRPISGRDRAWLIALAIAFLCWHVPLMYRTAAGQDESWFAVPGIAVLRSGVPQIPFLPARDTNSAVYRADEILYTLPPLSFYLQALVHLVLGLGLGQARMTSTLLGLFACFLVYDLARTWFRGSRGALLAVAAYLVSRAFYFPATTARPDMATVAFGLLAVRAAVLHRREPRRAHLVVAGIGAGLSLLAHPFGVVPTIQTGLALLLRPAALRTRLLDAALFSTLTLLVFSLWLPLIALHPDVFHIQFGNNVLGRAGPGLGATLRAPAPVLVYQVWQIIGHVSPIQAALYGLALCWSVWASLRMPRASDFAFHVWSSWLLLALFEGRHATLGYYAYPAALTSIALGAVAARTATRLAAACGAHRSRARRVATGLVVVLLLASFLPGSGIRTIFAYLRHWDDRAYDSHAWSKVVMRDIPPRALTAVDSAYVLDFYLARRPVFDATIHPLSYDYRTMPFEYVVLGHEGAKNLLPVTRDLTLVRVYGDKSDTFACYAELYRRGRASRSQEP